MKPVLARHRHYEDLLEADSRLSSKSAWHITPDSQSPSRRVPEIISGYHGEKKIRQSFQSETVENGSLEGPFRRAIKNLPGLHVGAACRD